MKRERDIKCMRDRYEEGERDRVYEKERDINLYEI